jgi:hypothetical protein
MPMIIVRDKSYYREYYLKNKTRIQKRDKIYKEKNKENIDTLKKLIEVINI